MIDSDYLYRFCILRENNPQKNAKQVCFIHCPDLLQMCVSEYVWCDGIRLCKENCRSNTENPTELDSILTIPETTDPPIRDIHPALTAPETFSSS